MSRRLHDTKLHKSFEKESKAKEEKRNKQRTKNDLKRLRYDDEVSIGEQPDDHDDWSCE